MAYLLITVAGVTHKDLLLNTAITLPVLQVNIELTRFFLFAPIVLVLLHLGVVGQLVLLARKTLEFAASIRMLEISDQRTHPLRLELDNFFFVQAMAGPERSRVVSVFLHGMSWLTLVALPLAMLLYIQIVFLPYHDVGITWVHRVAVLADIVLLVCIGVFLTRSEISFFRAFLRTSVHHPLGLLVTAALLVLVACFSMFVVTIPGEAVDRLAVTSSTERSAIERGGRYVFGYAVPATSASDSDSVLGMFRRNIQVVDQDLVVDKDVSPGEATLNLRNRDLRFARLDRSDLHQADLTGANLDGASLVGADLRGVVMQCASLDELLLTDDRRAARCASARAASFYKARMSEARMAGIDLRGARMEEARLDGADLSYGLMIGTDFASAQMERANLSGGAQLQGANFLLASLQGADLSGAKLQMADMANAGMQGANLSLASLDGAVLRDADLDGANLQMSRLRRHRLEGRAHAGRGSVGRHGVARAAAECRRLGPVGHGPDRPAAAERGGYGGAVGCHRAPGSEPAEDAPVGGSVAPARCRAERALGLLVGSAAVVQLRQEQRGGDGGRLPPAPHRLPVAADVPLAVRQWCGGHGSGASLHGAGLQGRHAGHPRPAESGRLPGLGDGRPAHDAGAGCRRRPGARPIGGARQRYR